MQNFTCGECRRPLFFENSHCLNCGHRVGFSTQRRALVSLTLADGADGTDSARYGLLDDPNSGERYRLCANTVDQDACNWLIPAGDPGRYCASCRLTEILPDLSDPAARTGWLKVETAKRRVLFTLYGLGLPVEGRDTRPDGLAFRFLQSTDAEPVITGHDDGIITLNLAEADASFRENMREKLGEAYRTVLGHLRHEIGHYYWDKLIAPSATWCERFRERFGDERASYTEAIERHYAQGPPADWQSAYISAYATMHPWEDWAESWAHYLHIVDTLETARAYGMAVSAPSVDDTLERVHAAGVDPHDYDDLSESWYALTFTLNDLNRSMGLPDPYPFAVSTDAVEKIRVVHDVIHAGATAVEEQTNTVDVTPAATQA